MPRPNEPDWSRLREIAIEVEQLHAAGHWDRAAFERMWRKGRRAVNGHGEFLEFIANAAEPDWV
ncbi:MAG TPA: hypothetical protein VK550_34725 [Polyangiaceae bacterium]|nr:hypothetical protein [Polyangiaceae bacterium]